MMKHDDLINCAIQKATKMLVQFHNRPRSSTVIWCRGDCEDDRGFEIKDVCDQCCKFGATIRYYPTHEVSLSQRCMDIDDLVRVISNSKIMVKLRITNKTHSQMVVDTTPTPSMIHVKQLLSVALKCPTIRCIILNTQHHFEDRFLKPTLKLFVNHPTLETIKISDTCEYSPTVKELRKYFIRDFRQKHNCAVSMMCYYLISRNQYVPLEMIKVIVQHINPRKNGINVVSWKK